MSGTLIQKLDDETKKLRVIAEKYKFTTDDAEYISNIKKFHLKQYKDLCKRWGKTLAKSYCKNKFIRSIIQLMEDKK